MAVEFKNILVKTVVTSFPDNVSIDVSYPGVLNIPSYLDLTLSAGASGGNNNNIPPAGVYDTWCTDVKDLIYPGVSYQAKLISSLDPNFDAKLLALGVPIIVSSNINYINYILNNDKRYTETDGFSFGDVQTALWYFDFGTFTTDPTAPYNFLNVIAIIADAYAHGANYVPTQPGDYYGIFVVPVGVTPNSSDHIDAQALIMQVTLAQTTVYDPVPIASSKCCECKCKC